jgi:hypothetical protein
MRCVACDSTNIQLCLDLGNQPLANNYKKNKDDPEEEFPLGVNLCHDCQHLQLIHFVEPEKMFKNYLWVSGTSSHYRAYMRWFANHVASAAPKAKTVFDIGCNDGSQLDAFSEIGFETHGVDPAENLASMRNPSHKINIGFFDSNYSSDLKYDVITAANVFGHTRNPYEFLQTCKKITHDDSLIFIQTSQANMVINNEFDTIYHEHVSFFNCYSMKRLVERAGLVLRDVFKTNIHGTTYVFVLAKQGDPQKSVSELLDIENAAGLRDVNTYVKWSEECVKIKMKLQQRLANKRVIAYGAAAKGNTLLNFTKINPEVIVDDNPLKVGLYTPGIGAQVVSRDYLLDLPNDEGITFLPLAWNLFDEIKNKILEKRNNPLDEFVPAHIKFIN